MTDFENALADLDRVRAGFERAASRPRSAVLPPRELASPETRVALTRARGRLRQAVYRDRLDRRAAPEADVVGQALIEAVVRQRSFSALDKSSVRIVEDAFSNLIERGYARSEIEAVFRRFRVRHAKGGETATVSNKK